jgi:cupin 2 domain-containing protein
MKDGNLFTASSTVAAAEVFEELLTGGNFKLERIVSTGQATPPGEWYDQDRDEWVVLLSGSAMIAFEGEPSPRTLRPGDYLQIAAHRRHRVEWTDPQQPTVWLALHYVAL